LRATEDKVKLWLRERGIAVPRGGIASTPQDAAKLVHGWSSGAVVKALIPTGRRGKAGAIRFAEDASQVEQAASNILETTVNGYVVKSVYVEQRIELAKEFYLSFYLENFPPQMLLSAEGGVEIEGVHLQRPDAVIAMDIDPLRGIRPWDAIAQWEKSSVDASLLPELGHITTQLYDAFVAGNSTMLEINPLGIDRGGKAVVVGAMMASDDPLFAAGSENDALILVDGNLPLTVRERRVIEANRKLPGGMMRYTELDGNIGMFIGGGGASLVQHDLVLAAGGRPANHMDASTTNPEKVTVLIEAILDNPRVKSLLVSWHYQQMAQIDRRVVPIIQALKNRKIDARKFPVVIRMFGPGEAEARRAASELEGVHYLPHGAPLEDGVRMIVDLTDRALQMAAMP
jgi:succinyl-CoA synthetase beta subunit/citryl-CoA synthetase large subunit